MVMNSTSDQKMGGSKASHVRYLQSIKFFNGLADIKSGEIVRITKHLGKGAAWVVRDNGDTWAEIGIGTDRCEYVEHGNAPVVRQPRLVGVYRGWNIRRSAGKYLIRKNGWQGYGNFSTLENAKDKIDAIVG